MKDQLTDEQIQTVLKALDDAIQKGPWDKSNFLKVIGKNLAKVRDDFVEKVGVHIQQKQSADGVGRHVNTEQQEVYISLYSARGVDLFTWERIISNLPRQMISRPIYENEEDVQNSIKLKTNKVNEAYVAILIDKSAILSISEDKTSFDKLGKRLLTLKDKCLFLENITYFVHTTGKYHLEHNRLIKN